MGITDYCSWGGSCLNRRWCPLLRHHLADPGSDELRYGLSTLLLFSSLPSIVLAPFTGVLADMWDRKKIVVITDIIRGLILAVAAFAAGHLTLGVIYGATAFHRSAACSLGRHFCSHSGMVKREELTAANVRNNFAGSATGIIGPIGAMLVGHGIHCGVCYHRNLFLAVAISEMFIRFLSKSSVQRCGVQLSSSLWSQLQRRVYLYLARR